MKLLLFFVTLLKFIDTTSRIYQYIFTCVEGV